MSAPRFEYVPIIGDPAKATLRVAFLSGISTAHGSEDTDHGRLYGVVSRPGDAYRLELFANVNRSAGSLVASGESATLGEYFDVSEESASGISGQAAIDAFSAEDRSVIVIPTFAVDVDVYTTPAAARALPGHDESGEGYGLAYLHAQAMREILTSGLPGAVPHLFGGAGLAAFVPTGADVQLPDITKLANVDQLRVAQVHLVKAIGAEQAEGIEAFDKVAKAARARYDAVVTRLAEANTEDEEAAEEEEAADGSGDFGVGQWSRT